MALSAHKQFSVTNLVMYFDPANRKSYSSGTAITDLSSAKNNGVLTNGPTFTNILGGYITLDGSNDYIEITRTGDFNVSTSNACCCLWFRANVINAGNALIFSNYKGSSSSFNIYQWSTGKVTAYFRDSSSNVASMDSMNNLSDGRWHFVCAQRTGTTTFELYVDGQIDNSTTTANISNIDFSIVNPLINSSCIIKKELCYWNGKWDGVEDYDMWLRIRKQNKKIFNFKEILVKHRIHNQSAFNAKGNDNKVDKLLSSHGFKTRKESNNIDTTKLNIPHKMNKINMKLI